MSNAPNLALAYTAEDQAIAYAIEADLQGQLSFEHFSVDQANEGPVLSELLAERYRSHGSVILLVSDAFIRNPNAMLDGLRLLQMGSQLLPVMLEGEAVGPDAPASLVDRQAEIMKYVGYWQTRYLDLRRQAKELSEEAGEDFDRYYRKIREIAGQVNDTLHQLKSNSWRRSLTELQIDNYRQLFIFLDREKQWEAYAAARPTIPRSSEESETPFLEVEHHFTDPAESQETKHEPTPDTEPSDLPSENIGKEDTSPSTAQEEDDSTTAPIENQETQPEPAIDDEPSTPPAGADELTQALSWIQSAWQLAENGDTDAAMALLETGRETLPEQRDLHYHLALMLATEQNDVAAAREQVDDLLTQAPTHHDALFLSGELYEAKGEHEAALDHWESLAEYDADYPDLAYRVGNLLFAHFPDRQYDASGWLKLAVKADPEAVDARFNYALLCINALDQPERAIKELRIVTQQQPTHAAAHFQLAELLREQDELDLARAAYLRARELDGNYATDSNEAAFNRVIVEQQQVELDQVREQYEAELVSQRETFQAALQDVHDQVEELQSGLKEDQENLDQLSLELEKLAAAEQTGIGLTALVSGATSGIGRATAIRLAEAGYRLILTGRRQERLEELARELAKEYETESQLLVFDIRERAATQQAIEGLAEDWQAIDLLINNAGKAKGLAPIHAGDLDHWDEMIDTNLRGLLYLTRAVSPGMVARKTGMIINVCSTAGKEVYPKGNVYCATKHAVDALTHAMRLDLVEHGIRVGQICPAHVEETEFALVRFDGDEERAKIYDDFQPLTSPDVAEAIYFMASQPAHVNVLDVVLQGKQQASSTVVDRSGRD